MGRRGPRGFARGGLGRGRGTAIDHEPLRSGGEFESQRARMGLPGEGGRRRVAGIDDQRGGAGIEPLLPLDVVVVPDPEPPLPVDVVVVPPDVVVVPPGVVVVPDPELLLPPDVVVVLDPALLLPVEVVVVPVVVVVAGNADADTGKFSVPP